jgi:Zn-dependent protease with chaperone function
MSLQGLQAAMAALKQRRFAEAIPQLEAFCQATAQSRSKEFFQAQMYLVKAYQENGQLAEAIALGQSMACCGVPTVEQWVDRVLPTLQAAVAPNSELATPSADPVVNAAPTPPASTPENFVQLSEAESTEMLKKGNKALKMSKFAEAVEYLEAYCQGTDPSTPDYSQAQMWLVKAFNGNAQTDPAIALCRKLLQSEKEYVKVWADRMMQTIAPNASAAPEPEKPPTPATATPATTSQASQARQSDQPASLSMNSVSRMNRGRSASNKAPTREVPKAGRATRGGVAVSMKGIASNLTLAAGTTVLLLIGMIFSVIVALLFIQGSRNPTMGFAIAAGLTILFNLLVFFIGPFIMDLIQGWVYSTRWTDLYEIQRQSPETGRILQEVCRKYNLSTPKLGIIEDDNPTAFTYGSLPNSARLVVSRGLFKYLDDDEVATVYAHELGHIVHWDFAVMTLAATLVQITYLLYVYAREILQNLGNSDVEKKIKGGAQTVVWMAYLFYLAGEYLVLYLSRVREYHADHFAAEVTGNPNGLSRALVKIAYGIMEQGQRQEQPSKVLQGTRSLGIADPRGVGAAGTAYRVAAHPSEVGPVFLWDMFNPWAWWMELNSTHPLTGKRVRALSTYAEQLGLEVEFNMAQVIRDGKLLNKKRLYGNFFIDLLTMQSQWIAVMLAVAIGGAIAVTTKNFVAPISIMLVLFGIATLAKLLAMYPDFHRAPEMDMLSLMSDPYASPLRGRPVRLEGDIIGRGNSGYRFSAELQFQDRTGMVFVKYTSRFGPLGNFLFGWTQAESFIHQPVKVVGWFRRGMAGWLDLAEMKCSTKWDISSYPRFWMTVQGAAAIALGFVLPIVLR